MVVRQLGQRVRKYLGEKRVFCNLPLDGQMLQCMQEHVGFLSVAQVDDDIANACIQDTGIEQTHCNKHGKWEVRECKRRVDQVGMVYLRDTMRATERPFPPSLLVLLVSQAFSSQSNGCLWNTFAKENTDNILPSRITDTIYHSDTSSVLHV